MKIAKNNIKRIKRIKKSDFLYMKRFKLITK